MTAWVLIAVVLTTAPLVVRRKYPIAAFCVILAALIAGSGNGDRPSRSRRRSSPPTARSSTAAAACWRWRVAAGAIIVTTTFPNTAPPVAAQYTALLVVLPTVAAGHRMRTWRQRAGDSAARLRRAEAEHEAATQRAIELERARIASELHDVVTHNVSVMVVQAGAARRCWTARRGRGLLAGEALLAVEASGRNAMTELRHLLSLLGPAGLAASDEAAAPRSPAWTGVGRWSAASVSRAARGAALRGAPARAAGRP